MRCVTRLQGRPKRTWLYQMEMQLKEMGLDLTPSAEVAQDKKLWAYLTRALSQTKMQSVNDDGFDRSMNECNNICMYMYKYIIC